MVSIYVYNIWTKQQIFKSEVSQVAWAKFPWLVTHQIKLI